MAATDAEIRLACKGIIKTLYPTAAVFGWNVLSHELNEWPGLFRTTDYGTSGITHGWIIKRAGTTSEWRNPRRDRTSWIYDIWGFYGFRSGKEGDNSDEEFAVITEAVFEGFQAKPTLDLDLQEHGLLQQDMITTIDCGEETLHFAKGKLTVLVC